MATIAVLLGMEPGPVERCRVLEVGCAGATNLIAMAGGLPGSEFVGIDASGRHIEEARETIERLGLRNVTAEHRDLRDPEAVRGTFDYIIAHGLFSWIPPDARERLLAICREHLAPDGVAYVSYNTYPGWSLLRSVRDMMLYRTRRLTDPWERAEEAKRFIDFLAGAVPPRSGPFGIFLEAYARDLAERWELVDERAAAALLHDELEAVNEPMYFHDFVGQASRHGLQYLAEASLQGVMPSRYPPEVIRSVRGMALDLVEAEQYLDFLTNRTFRSSLLCHAEVGLARKLRPDAGRLSTLFVTSQAGSEEALDLTEGTVSRFRAPDGAVLAVDHAVTKAAMDLLGRTFPDAIGFDELLSSARDRVRRGGGPGRHTGDDQDGHVLAVNLLQGFTYSRRLVELNVHRPTFTLRPGDRPEADAFARLLAGRGQSLVTNARHERVRLDPFARHLLALLDGSRDVGDLAAAVEELVADGEVVPAAEEGDVDVAGAVRAGLDWLASAALLRR